MPGRVAFCLLTVMFIMLIVAMSAALAQPTGKAAPPAGAPDPAASSANGQPPAGMGPPGMPFPKDVVVVDAPKITKVGPNKSLWIVAGVVIVIAVAAWAFSRAKKG